MENDIQIKESRKYLDNIKGVLWIMGYCKGQFCRNQTKFSGFGISRASWGDSKHYPPDNACYSDFPGLELFILCFKS